MQQPAKPAPERPDTAELRDVTPGASPDEPGGASNFFESPLSPQSDPNLTPEQKRAFAAAFEGPEGRGEGQDAGGGSTG